MITKRNPPPCSQEELKDMLEYTEDGYLWWNYHGKKKDVDKPIGGTHKLSGYGQVWLKGVIYRTHRLVYYWHTGEWPDIIDHINGDKSDNRIENLRAVSHTANAHGARKPMKRSDGGLPGTSYNKRDGRWYARIGSRGTLRHIGSYDTTEEAHEAYLAAKAELRQELGIA